MMDVSVNHLLLQIESNNFKLSCIRFCQDFLRTNVWSIFESVDYISNEIIYGGFIFVQHLIVFGHGHAKDDGRHVFEAMDPLLPLGALASNVEQPEHSNALFGKNVNDQSNWNSAGKRQLT